MGSNPIETEDALCRSCRHWDFRQMSKQGDLQSQNEEFHLFEENETGTWHILGYLDAIVKRRDCPFCRLVIKSRWSCWPEDESTPDGVASSEASGIRIKCNLAACVAGGRKLPNGQVQKAFKLKIRSNRNWDSKALEPQMNDGEIKLSADDSTSIGVLPL